MATSQRACSGATALASRCPAVTYRTGELGVSDMTVRRDLKQLAQAGELRVVHGGAGLPHGTLRTADFASRAEHELAAALDDAGVAVHQEEEPS